MNTLLWCFAGVAVLGIVCFVLAGLLIISLVKTRNVREKAEAEWEKIMKEYQ